MCGHRIPRNMWAVHHVCILHTVHHTLCIHPTTHDQLNTQGTHKSLKRNDNAKATVAAIIDGTGSLGAAFGPLIAGAVSEYVRLTLCVQHLMYTTDESPQSWDYTFYTLMSCCFVAALVSLKKKISHSPFELQVTCAS